MILQIYSARKVKWEALQRAVWLRSCQKKKKRNLPGSEGGFCWLEPWIQWKEESPKRIKQSGKISKLGGKISTLGVLHSRAFSTSYIHTPKTIDWKAWKEKPADFFWASLQKTKERLLELCPRWVERVWFFQHNTCTPSSVLTCGMWSIGAQL